jgi:ABC-2 type transport system ATP-binding protein
MISVKNVSKNFGSIQALHDVSFEIPRGEVVGFLGENGAGKTTLMRILTTYFPPTQGRVSIAGLDVGTSALQIRRKIGYLPENPPIYPSMSVFDYLKFAAQLKDVSHREIKKCVDRVLEQCMLKDVYHRRIGVLSKGYKQRVGIAQAIINDPDVLILDEPTSGLDPVQVKQVRHLIKNFDRQRTIILSTHILPEIELMADRVLIIKQGRILVDSPLTNLLNQPQGKVSLEEVFLKTVAV